MKIFNYRWAMPTLRTTNYVFNGLLVAVDIMLYHRNAVKIEAQS